MLQCVILLDFSGKPFEPLQNRIVDELTTRFGAVIGLLPSDTVCTEETRTVIVWGSTCYNLWTRITAWEDRVGIWNGKLFPSRVSELTDGHDGRLRSCFLWIWALERLRNTFVTLRQIMCWRMCLYTLMRGIWDEDSMCCAGLKQWFVNCLEAVHQKSLWPTETLWSPH